MIRAISIVLIFAIALQAVGCTTWRTVARLKDIPESNREAAMRDRIIGKLTEGMRVRIKIREGTRLPIEGRVIVCVIEDIGPTSLVGIQCARNLPGHAGERLTLRYIDIESVVHLEPAHEFVIFCVAGLGVGAALGFYLFVSMLSGVELD